MFELHWFTDDEDDYQVVIFARNLERAEEIYEAVSDRLGLMPEGWVGSEWDAWQTLGLVRHQREAERRNVEGIGVYHSQTGWAILPIDYAAMDLSKDPRRGAGLNS